MGCGVPVLKLRYAALLKRAAQALGSEAEAERWLNNANPALGGENPYAMAETQAGFRQVLDELELLGAE